MTVRLRFKVTESGSALHAARCRTLAEGFVPTTRSLTWREARHWLGADSSRRPCRVCRPSLPTMRVIR